MSVSQALNARMLGTGDDILVLAHGFGTNQSVWSRMLPALAARYRVLLFDLPCAGSSAADFFDIRRHGTLDGYIEDLLHVLTEQKVQHCTYVGHSLSGMIGLLAARRVPQRFDRLIMIGASPRYLNAPGYGGGMDPSGVGQLLDAIDTVFQTWAKSYAPIALKRAMDHPATQEFTESLLSMRPDIALLTAKLIFSIDFRADLPECPVSTAILQTRDDPAVPQAVATYLHAHIPGSDLRIIETTGHLPHLTDPGLMLEALAPYLPPTPPPTTH
ncbi:hydrolase [Elstera cyanobacteriorum]|uniref:AB hydrolase-1 domain-containing protein n=1 Tax=Elstera cyanobacteriorum TaxID=2022747 RepID=A0A255XPH8_9PROT|nr:alpha/beta hydrolase [Elstera cyanobacteriorum]OYQ18869.1 hypothetical protein CHR90_11510 [Elstera cyanobacteriorum]GFZ77254.1 hydrolase [Elstera cyanobacteriorum]